MGKHKSKWSSLSYLQSLDAMNLPFRPVNPDGTPIKIKDMTSTQKSTYRKWLLSRHAYHDNQDE